MARPRRTRTLFYLTALIALCASAAAAQVSNVLVPTVTPARKTIALDRFTPSLPIVEGPFECGTPEPRAADLLFPHNSMIWYAYAPTREDPRMTMSVFTDSTGRIIRYTERRGLPIKPDTRGLSPSQVGAAVQAAARANRATLITVDYLSGRASVSNVGGDSTDVMAMGTPEEIATLESLGKPGERAARVFEKCLNAKRSLGQPPH